MSFTKQISNETDLKLLIDTYKGLNSIREKKKLENIFSSKYPRLIKTLIDAPLMGFYPTPLECLNHSIVNSIINNSKRILEPSAGIGSMMYYIINKNKKIKLTAYEFNSDLADFLKNHFIKATIYNEDFLLSNRDHSDIDTIFCNPPFTLNGDKLYYINFYFKCLDIMVKSNIKSRPEMLFICPLGGLSDNKDTDYIDPSSIFNLISHNKINAICDMLNINKITKQEYKIFQNTQEINDNPSLDYLMNILPYNISFITKCWFKTTAYAIGIYNVSGFMSPVKKRKKSVSINDVPDIKTYKKDSRIIKKLKTKSITPEIDKRVHPVKRPGSSWIDHVKQYAIDNNISYKQSLTESKATYIKSAKTPYVKKVKVPKTPVVEPSKKIKSDLPKVIITNGDIKYKEYVKMFPGYKEKNEFILESWFKSNDSSRILKKKLKTRITMMNALINRYSSKYKLSELSQQYLQYTRNELERLKLLYKYGMLYGVKAGTSKTPSNLELFISNDKKDVESKTKPKKEKKGVESKMEPEMEPEMEPKKEKKKNISAPQSIIDDINKSYNTNEEEDRELNFTKSNIQSYKTDSNGNITIKTKNLTVDDTEEIDAIILVNEDQYYDVALSQKTIGRDGSLQYIEYERFKIYN